MVIDERECRKETIAEVARQIMIAGRTAPKGKGIDLIEIVAVTGETIELWPRRPASHRSRPA